MKYLSLILIALLIGCENSIPERTYTKSEINIMNKCGVIGSDRMRIEVVDKISNCLDKMEKNDYQRAKTNN